MPTEIGGTNENMYVCMYVCKLPFSWTVCCHTTKEYAFTLMEANKLKLGNHSGVSRSLSSRM